MKPLPQALPMCTGHHSRAGAHVSRLLATAILALSVLLLTPAMGSAQDDPAAILQRMFDAQNRKDLNGVLAVLTDDLVQLGGACAAAPNSAHRCDGKAAFAKAFGPPDTWPTLRFVDTPRVDGDTVTGRVEARFDNLPPLFKDLGIEHVVGPATVRARGGQLSNILFESDPTDAQTASFYALVGAPAATDGRTIFGETAATQNLFAGVWGVNAAQQWGTEHSAELKRLGR
jgi:ketosteroid isomerase-like protein